jgi:ribosome biogenesis GTPase
LNTNTRLVDLGWNPDFLRQLDLDEVGTTTPARVSGVHRNRIDVLTAEGALALIPASDLSTGAVAVGDWLLARDGIALRVLDRRTELARRAAGSTVARQLIAANLDTALIVSSCNADFNVGRLERYLVLAASAGIEPVIVLTKADTCADPAAYVAQAQAMQRGLAVVALNAHADDIPAALALWCRKGQTVVLLGSSGVGKTTLSNALTGGSAAVQGIREGDAKGRHTTTSRSLVEMAGGGWLIDTPGVRELQVTDVADGIEAHFDDLAEIASGCRFSDCKHGVEPGCAVQAAIAAGTLDPGRLARWQKLSREDRFNTQTIYEAHQRNRTFGRMHRKILDKRKPK